MGLLYITLATAIFLAVALPYVAAFAVVVTSEPHQLYGMRIYVRQNLGNVCAFSIALPFIAPIFVVDKDALATGTEDQVRFVIAHELGHVMLGHFTPLSAFIPLTRRIDRSQMEADADSFATKLTGVKRDVMGEWRW